MVSFKKLRQIVEIQGNGHMASKEISIGSFLRLHIGGQGTIELIQSKEEKVVVETDENLLDHIEAGNAGRTLYVSTEAKFKKPVFTNCNIKIYMRQLDNLVIRCENGNVICPQPIVLSNPLEVKIQSVGNTELNFEATAIKLSSQSVGELTLRGKCESIDIKNQSVGNLLAAELFANDVKIKNMANGNVELYAEKNISISHYGNGTVFYKGDANLREVKQHGSGLIKHVD